MGKLKGKAKAAFLARINKGRKAAGLSTIKSKTKSALKKVTKSKKRSSLKGSKTINRSVAKTKTKSRGRSRMSAKSVAKKLGFGAGVGVAIRLATMFFQDRNIREIGSRGANVASSWAGGPVGNAGYQIADAAVTRLIPFAATGRVGNGGGQITIPNPIQGGA